MCEKTDIIRNRRDVWLVFGRTKNGEPMMKPVNPAARWCLKYIPFKWSDQYYYKRWHDALKVVGLVDFVPHDLRHSLASDILSRGGNLAEVGAALHQKSLQSTKRYAHRYPESLRQIMHRIGKRANARAG